MKWIDLDLILKLEIIDEPVSVLAHSIIDLIAHLKFTFFLISFKKNTYLFQNNFLAIAELIEIHLVCGTQSWLIKRRMRTFLFFVIFELAHFVYGFYLFSIIDDKWSVELDAYPSGRD